MNSSDQMIAGGKLLAGLTESMAFRFILGLDAWDGGLLCLENRHAYRLANSSLNASLKRVDCGRVELEITQPDRQSQHADPVGNVGAVNSVGGHRKCAKKSDDVQQLEHYFFYSAGAVP